jgi:hypothetical protein
MPFKSQAQRRKFGEMVKQGKITQKTFDEWNAETPANIPEKAAKKPMTLERMQAIAKAKFGKK